MATNGFRVSVVFQQQASVATSWTENFWNAASDYNKCYAQAVAMKQALNAVHGSQAFSNYIRISYWPRGRKLKGVSYPTAAPGIDTEEGNADFPTTAYLVSSTDADGNYTQQWLKGIQDSSVGNGGRYVANAIMPVAFKALKKEICLASNNWCIRILDPAQTGKTIISIDAALGLINAPAHGYTVGSTIKGRVSGVLNYPLAGGTHWLYVVDADTLQYYPWTAATGVTVKLGNAKVKNLTYILNPITDFILERVTKKNVGRPTRVLSGKKKRARSV